MIACQISQCVIWADESVESDQVTYVEFQPEPTRINVPRASDHYQADNVPSGDPRADACIRPSAS